MGYFLVNIGNEKINHSKYLLNKMNANLRNAKENLLKNKRTL